MPAIIGLSQYSAGIGDPADVLTCSSPDPSVALELLLSRSNDIS
jgi:hypothetical protein